MATTPEGALPTYNFEKVVTIGKLVKADLTVTNASGELYGDDALAEKVDMFASGSVALETDDKTNEVHAALHGATVNEETKEVTDSDGDVAPRGGLAYYNVFRCNSGAWRVTKEFTDEAACIAWCDEKLGKTTAPGGGGGV